MEAQTAEQVANYFFDLFRRNKGVTTIMSDFNESIGNEILLFWNKVKPIFIVEDKKLVENIEQRPEDKVLQGGLIYQISKQMNEELFKKDVVTFLDSINKLEKGSSGDIGISANTVNMTGKNNAGIQNNFR